MGARPCARACARHGILQRAADRDGHARDHGPLGPAAAHGPGHARLLRRDPGRDGRADPERGDGRQPRHTVPAAREPALARRDRSVGPGRRRDLPDSAHRREARLMAEYYFALRYVHIACAIASVSLFTLRGVLMFANTRWHDAATVRYLSYSIDTLLLTAALMLTTVIHQYPFSTGWLT